MPHFTFKFGAMTATKTRDLLAIDYNFRVDNHLHSYVIKPSTDNRDGQNIIKSRDGGEREVDLLVGKYTNIFEQVKNVMPDIVLCDESQFLTKQQVIQLSRVVDELNIPVIAWGLKNDFINEMFEGTKYLLLYADKFEQIKTICRMCSSTATMNMRLHNGSPIFHGAQVHLGGNERYIPTCRKCYHKLKTRSQNGE